MGFILAIDGPAGAGKSTVARLVAERLGFCLVDTGAMYRCVALRAAERGIDWLDDARLGTLAIDLRLEFQLANGTNRVFLDGADVTESIRQPELSKGASAVAARPAVREALLGLQRRLAKSEKAGVVLEGRDIGTVVCPDANVKVFLTASPETRARRRFEELSAKGASTTFEAVLADQLARDRDDENRPIAPLKAAADAIRVDTTGLETEEVVLHIASLVRQHH
jgi:cytidylate kinase